MNLAVSTFKAFARCENVALLSFDFFSRKYQKSLKKDLSPPDAITTGHNYERFQMFAL